MPSLKRLKTFPLKLNRSYSVNNSEELDHFRKFQSCNSQYQGEGIPGDDLDSILNTEIHPDNNTKNNLLCLRKTKSTFTRPVGLYEENIYKPIDITKLNRNYSHLAVRNKNDPIILIDPELTDNFGLPILATGVDPIPAEYKKSVRSRRETRSRNNHKSGERLENDRDVSVPHFPMYLDIIDRRSSPFDYRTVRDNTLLRSLKEITENDEKELESSEDEIDIEKILHNDWEIEDDDIFEDCTMMGNNISYSQNKPKLSRSTSFRRRRASGQAAAKPRRMLFSDGSVKGLGSLGPIPLGHFGQDRRSRGYGTSQSRVNSCSPHGSTLRNSNGQRSRTQNNCSWDQVYDNAAGSRKSSASSNDPLGPKTRTSNLRKIIRSESIQEISTTFSVDGRTTEVRKKKTKRVTKKYIYDESDTLTDTYADFDYNNEDDSIVFENFKPDDKPTGSDFHIKRERETRDFIDQTFDERMYESSINQMEDYTSTTKTRQVCSLRKTQSIKKSSSTSNKNLVQRLSGFFRRLGSSKKSRNCQNRESFTSNKKSAPTILTKSFSVGASITRNCTLRESRRFRKNDVIGDF